MKTNIYICLWAYILVCLHVSAQHVSQHHAEHVASLFLSGLNNTSEASQDSRSVPLNVRPMGKNIHPALYAISQDNNWVLIAGDKRVPPILAYSDSKAGGFPSDDDMPPAMADLIGWYKAQIEYVQDSLSDCGEKPEWALYENTRSLPNRTEIVSPLLKRGIYENMWRQSGNYSMEAAIIEKSYNKFCPVIYNDNDSCKTIVGCVAVATSQVMWYWQWPKAAIVEDDNGNQLVREYDWNLMPCFLHNGSSLAEADMVANLLHDVGVAVHMDYGCKSSVAFSDSIVTQLKNRFHYHSDAVINRSSYNNSNWIQLLKTELNNRRPILYSGRNSSGEGHQFVIDGYNSNDEFHMNFGHYGNGNGYFLLDSLNTHTYPYRYDQDAIINVYPDIMCDAVNYPSHNTSTNNFELVNGGGISVGNWTIASNQKGVIFSGDYVKLTSGFHITHGATVHIAIKDIDCENSSPDNAPLRHTSRTKKDNDSNKNTNVHNQFAAMPNPVKDILSITSTEDLTQINVYTLNGQCMLQTNQTDIDVSSLPQGMYILHALAASGTIWQAKFIKE